MQWCVFSFSALIHWYMNQRIFLSLYIQYNTFYLVSNQSGELSSGLPL
jgi:hypothetical protein